MIKVITYGTYDLLHYGHIRLLERAKALGDYLIVGVTADDFDKNRGKINVQQSLSERIAAVRDTGLADEIIVEEYEGQKIDDIRQWIDGNRLSAASMEYSQPASRSQIPFPSITGLVLVVGYARNMIRHTQRDIISAVKKR